MILQIFAVFVGLALVMITIGLAKPSESAQALIGFFLLFVCALIISTGNLEFETGSQVNTTYVYDAAGKINFSSQNIAYDYDNLKDAGNSQSVHYIGYYLALASAVGFAGTLWSLKKTKMNED